MSFENYECDGQMSLDDLYPNQCCGVKPWLHITKCWMDGRIDIPQRYVMYYICPKCKKHVVDEFDWTVRSSGTYEEAAWGACKVWNNPEAKFKQDDRLYVAWHDREIFEKMYGFKPE